MVQWTLYEVRKLSILPILCRHVFGHARFSTMGGCTVGTVQGGSAACPRENNVSTMVRTNQLSLLTRRRVFEGIQSP